jgi:hypothetical protein
MNSPTVEYVMLVKLPSSGAFHCSPSGDTEYETACQKAIFENLPQGFEIAWATEPTWPKDKDGLTWVKLYCTDQKKAVEYFRDRLERAEKRLQEINKIADQMKTLL